VYEVPLSAARRGKAVLALRWYRTPKRRVRRTGVTRLRSLGLPALVATFRPFHPCLGSRIAPPWPGPRDGRTGKPSDPTRHPVQV